MALFIRRDGLCVGGVVLLLLPAVLRADGIFRGVVVPPGRHTVQFRYANPDVQRGIRLTVAALALIVVLFVLSTRAVGQLPLMKRFKLR